MLFHFVPNGVIAHCIQKFVSAPSHAQALESPRKAIVLFGNGCLDISSVFQEGNMVSSHLVINAVNLVESVRMTGLLRRLCGDKDRSDDVHVTFHKGDAL